MPSFMLLGVVESNGERHLALLAQCTKREEFLDAVREVNQNENNAIKEILCLQGNVLPVKVIGNKISSIEISKTEYPLMETNIEFISTPVYIGGNHEGEN